MNGKEFHLIKELTYSRLTAICAFEPPFFAYLLCGSLLNFTSSERATNMTVTLCQSGQRVSNFTTQLNSSSNRVIPFRDDLRIFSDDLRIFPAKITLSLLHGALR